MSSRRCDNFARSARPSVINMNTAVLLVLLGSVQLILADNLAILLGTLKTYQRAACDEETMSLRCPLGTSISVVFARYGRIAEAAVGKCNNPELPASVSPANETCLLSHALQYSLLQTVVEICQKNRNCKFNTTPKSFHSDPCPGLAKYIEVAYKCRPYEFRSKVACENEPIHLLCYPGNRIAILSASYGRTEYESLQCPQPHGVKEETCTAPYATETVLQLCHGKRRCSVIANSSTFGDTCKPDTRTYLKIIYTCVPRGVLRDEFAGDVENDEVNLAPEFDEGFDRTDFKTEFSPSPNLGQPQPSPRDNDTMKSPTVSTSPPRARTNNDMDVKTYKHKSVGKEGKSQRRVHSSANVIEGTMSSTTTETTTTTNADVTTPTINCTTTQLYTTEEEREEDRIVIGYLSEWINAYSFVSKNQEKFYLYIVISVAVGGLLFLGLIIGRLLVSRHRNKKDDKFHNNSETLPNGFTDEISEIDADIDLTTPVPIPMQDPSTPETQLAERLHTERYYGDNRLAMGQVHHHHHQIPSTTTTSTGGVRVDLGNHMIGADSLHTILRAETPRSMSNKSYYYG